MPRTPDRRQRPVIACTLVGVPDLEADGRPRGHAFKNAGQQPDGVRLLARGPGRAAAGTPPVEFLLEKFLREGDARRATVHHAAKRRNAIEDIEAAMKGMLEPEYVEKVIGHAEVRQTFKASGVGTIAGSYILDGVIQRGSTARLIRDGVVLHEGEFGSIKRFNDDVKEVKTGFECGLVLENYNDIKEGDQIEAYIMED